MGRRLVVVIDPWFGVRPDEPKEPVRFEPIPIVDASGQPMSPESRETFLAEQTWGDMAPAEIARHFNRLTADLKRAQHAAKLPIWYLALMVVTVGYLGVSAYIGDPIAVWIVKGAIVFYLLSWIWLGIVLASERFRTSR